MAETNGHAPEGADLPAPDASDAELDQLLAGLFEPQTVEIAPGRLVEIRPLILKNSDRLYMGGMAGAELQRFLLSRCVFINGHRLGEAGADRLPIAVAGKLVPLIMSTNGMNVPQAEGEAEAEDPKA
jgi:hypothetical protein